MGFLLHVFYIDIGIGFGIPYRELFLIYVIYLDISIMNWTWSFLHWLYVLGLGISYIGYLLYVFARDI